MTLAIALPLCWGGKPVLTKRAKPVPDLHRRALLPQGHVAEAGTPAGTHLTLQSYALSLSSKAQLYNPSWKHVPRASLVYRSRQARTSICTIRGRSTACRRRRRGPCLPERDTSPATVVTNCPTSRQPVHTCAPCDDLSTRAWLRISAQLWQSSCQQTWSLSADGPWVARNLPLLPSGGHIMPWKLLLLLAWLVIGGGGCRTGVSLQDAYRQRPHSTSRVREVFSC